MGRKKIYATAADRLRAYRARQADQVKSATLCRRKRLEAAGGEVLALLEELIAWRGSLSEDLQGSALAGRLDVAIVSLRSAVYNMAGIDMPLGIGSD